jgi:hypothetical protein
MSSGLPSVPSLTFCCFPWSRRVTYWYIEMHHYFFLPNAYLISHYHLIIVVVVVVCPFTPRRGTGPYYSYYIIRCRIISAVKMCRQIECDFKTKVKITLARRRIALEYAINPLRPSGNHMYLPLWPSVKLHFVFFLFLLILGVNSDYFLKQH